MSIATFLWLVLAFRSAPFGDWGGIMVLGGHVNAVQAHLVRTDSGTVAGSMDVFGEESSEDLIGLRIVGDSVIAVLPSRLNGPTDVRAVVVGDTLRGTATRGGTVGRIQLLHLAALDTAVAHQGEGMYVAASDTLIINRVTPTWLAATDVTGHQLRLLFPAGPNEFIAGPTLFAALPVSWQVRLRDVSSKNAAVTVTRDGKTIEAHRAPVYTEEVNFNHGGVRLAGTFIRPRAPGRYPVVVFLHGSGASIRTSHLGSAYLLASRGIASLIYDKRGSGGSTGELHMSTMDQIAGDAVAGAGLLMTRADVDSARIGFEGISEGGLTAEIAATQFPRTAFVVALSGGGPFGFAQWEDYEGADQLRTDGRFSDADIAEALAFQHARDAYARTRKKWGSYAAALSTARSRPWYAYPTTDFFGWSTPDSPGWEMKALNYFYDPLPVLRAITCPVLNLYGEYDVPEALRLEVPMMREILAQAANHDVTVEVLPHVNHNFFVAQSGNVHEMDKVTSYSAELFPFVIGWLEQRLLVARPHERRRGP